MQLSVFICVEAAAKLNISGLNVSRRRVSFSRHDRFVHVYKQLRQKSVSSSSGVASKRCMKLESCVAKTRLAQMSQTWKRRRCLRSLHARDPASTCETVSLCSATAYQTVPLCSATAYQTVSLFIATAYETVSLFNCLQIDLQSFCSCT